MTQQGNTKSYQGDNKLILGIVLGVVTFGYCAIFIKRSSYVTTII